MEAIEFIINYPKYLDMIGKVIREDLKPCINSLRKIDPHDLIEPESWFQSENAAIGFVFRLFLKEVKKSG